MKAIPMSLLRPMPVAVIALPMLFALAACGGSRSSGGTSGEGGVSESGATSTAAGAGGNEAADAAIPDAAPYCPGDQASWDKLTAQPFPCQTSADCCVIMSPCVAEAQVVTAALQVEASAAWPYCEVDCTDCIPPAIDVACVAGMCRGRAVAAEPPDSPLRRDHCGDDAKVVDFSVASGLHFGCAG
jgi:hypothetical protein